MAEKSGNHILKVTAPEISLTIPRCAGKLCAHSYITLVTVRVEVIVRLKRLCQMHLANLFSLCFSTF